MMTFYMTPRRRAYIRRYYPGDRIARNTEISSDVHIPVDVKEEQDSFVINAIIPGLESEDVNIEILENVVNIRGEFKHDAEEGEEYLRRERPLGEFHRQLRFSTKLEAADAEAALNNGILTLRVPKVEEERPKTIKVKTK